jgi:type IV secretion system protein TrbB
VQGFIPPVVSRPSFAIRKPAPVVYSLEDYVAKGVVTSEQRDPLSRAVTEGKNILVGGGTGTGKTTLANALLRLVGERTNDRLYIAEDAPAPVLLAEHDDGSNKARQVRDARRRLRGAAPATPTGSSSVR